MCEIKSENNDQGFCNDKDLFDFINYFEYSKHFNNANKLVAREMKDETCRVFVKCFIGFKSKSCIFIREDKLESEIAKVLITFLLIKS